jgi:hypothetical protein
LRFFFFSPEGAAVFFPASFFSAGAFPAGALPPVDGFFSAAFGGILDKIWSSWVLEESGVRGLNGWREGKGYFRCGMSEMEEGRKGLGNRWDL